MPRINVRLDDVQSSKFELFPEGLHPVEIQPSSKLRSDDTGPFVQFIAKCIDGEMEDNLIGWRCYLTDAALWNIKNMLEAMGFEWDEDGFELEDLFEEKVIVQNGNQEWPVGSGEYRNQIEGYFPYEEKKGEKQKLI